MNLVRLLVGRGLQHEQATVEVQKRDLSGKGKIGSALSKNRNFAGYVGAFLLGPKRHRDQSSRSQRGRGDSAISLSNAG